MMKKLILLHVMMLSSFCSTASFSMVPDDSPAPSLTTPLPSRKLPSQRKIIDFQPMKFLKKAVLQIDEPELNKKIQNFVADKSRDQQQIASLCWEALKGLKSQIIKQNKLDDLPFCYMTMAKLFQATHSCPSFELSTSYKIHLPSNPEGTKNRLNSYLRERMEYFNLNKSQEKDKSKVYKWSLLYNAMLHMDYVKNNPESENNTKFIAEAFKSLSTATDINTTKSVHLLLAHLYLEHGHYLGLDPSDVNIQVAKEIDLIENIKEKGEAVADGKGQRSIPTFWDIAAKPPYYTDTLVKQDISALLSQIVHEEDAERLEQPILHLIPMASDEANLLPPRVIDEGYLLDKLRKYTIQGRTFVNWDVSGHDFRCFFNSVGLKPSDQIKLLLDNKHDPLVRAMIANEIVSAWRSYYELPQPVRQALNAQDLVLRQARVDRLMGSDRQEEQRDNINREQDAILKEFRIRASKESVFESFVTHQIGTRIDNEINSPYPMMVMQQDVGGEDHNHLPNLSTIDAMMHLNHIGLRIYGINGSNLQLIHSYIPQGATEIAHNIYKKNDQHFTALVPQNDEDTEIEISEKMEVDYSKSNKKIQAAYDEDARQGKISRRLSKLLKKRFPEVVNNTGSSDADVRLALFFNAQKIQLEQISHKDLIPWGKSRVGVILNENGVYSDNGYSVKETDDIFDAFLSTGLDFHKDREGRVKPFADAIAKKLGLSAKQVQMHFLNQFRENKYTGTLPSEEERLEIIDLYTKGEKYCSIHKKMEMHYSYIFEVLHTDLPENLKPKIIDPKSIKLTTENIKERDQKIVSTFKSLQKKNNGKNPSASAVSRECGHSLKLTLNALKEAGLIEGTTKAKHLNPALVSQIKEYWAHKGWETAPDKQKHYEMTATKFSVKIYQVIDLLLGRAYNGNTGLKRNRQITPNEIKAAYEDLSGEQKQNPLPHLLKLLPIGEQTVKKFLKEMNNEATENSQYKKQKTQ